MSEQPTNGDAAAGTPVADAPESQNPAAGNAGNLSDPVDIIIAKLLR